LSIQPAHADARTDQLRARRAQLVAQLAALQPGRNSANAELAAAEDAYNQQQAKVLAVQTEMDGINAQLKTLDAQVKSDEVAAAAARKALAQITRVTYESSQDGSLMTAVFNARDFSSAMDSLSNAQRTTAQIQDLENTLNQKEADLQRKRLLLQQDFAQVTAMQDQLQAEANKLMILVTQRNSVAASLNGPARRIAAEIADIDYQLAGGSSAASGSYTPPPGGGSCGNHFGYGQCTWYVASRRCIPWIGNAKDWFYAAAQYGYSEGHTPQPGAVGVYWPGRGGASSVGHVVYVEAVGPQAGIPAGYFKLSEMNWNGWNQVDYRVVPNDPNVFQGFIYGHP
jgi:surface antigen